ncbi:MAG: Ig-like domain-containing protein, partial [Pseudomonadota bacterium]
PPLNTVPVASDDSGFSVEAGQSLDIAVSDLLANDSDVDGDRISITAATGGANNIVTLNADGTVSYTPAAGFSGSDTFSYTVSDGQGSSDTATVTIDVTAPASDSTPGPTPEPAPDTVLTLSLLDEALAFDGNTAVVLDHQDAFELADGALSLSFRSDDVQTVQGLFSKDSSGKDDGGHLTLTIENGQLRLRAQTTEESLIIEGGAVQEGAMNTALVTWQAGLLTLSLNGIEIGTADGWTGLGPNQEPIVLGAAQSRSGDGIADRIEEFFTGEIAEATLSSDPESGRIDPPVEQPAEDRTPPPSDGPADPPVDQDAALDLGVTDAAMFAPYAEWVIENPSVSGNPFDLDAKAIFTHTETGEVRETGLFYTGEGSYAFRFSGVEAGTWSFVTQSADSDLDGYFGTVEVAVDPTARGFVVAEGTKFAQQLGDGSLDAILPNYAMIDTNLEVYYNNPAAIQEVVDTFIHQHGFTGLHIAHPGGQLFDIDSTTAHSGSRIDGSQGYDPDPRAFAALEQLIMAAHDAGAVVHIWPWGDSQRGQTPDQLPGGEGGAEHLRILEYFADRLGPLPGWTLGTGFDNDEWSTPEQTAAAAAYFDAQTDFDHLTSVRAADPNYGTDHSSGVIWNVGQDVADYEHLEPTYEVYVAAFEAVHNGQALDKPVLSGDRFRVRDHHEKDYTEAQTVDGLWISTMAGGASNIWGNLIDPVTGQSERTGQFGSFSYATETQEQISTWDRFFNDEDRFALDAVRANELTGGVNQGQYALFSESEDRIVIYAEDTDTIQFNLNQLVSDPDFANGVRITAVDTELTYREIDLGTRLLTDQTITLEQNSDWAISVEAI